MGTFEDLYWNIHHEMSELKLRRKFDAQLKMMETQDHHKFKDTRDKWQYARDKVVRLYHENKSKKAGK
jgi:hypothetical protein